MEHSQSSFLSHMITAYNTDKKQFFYDLLLCKQCLRKYGPKNLSFVMKDIVDQGLWVVLLRFSLRQKNPFARIRSLISQYLAIYPESVAWIHLPGEVIDMHRSVLEKSFGSFVFAHDTKDIVVEGSQGYMMRSFSHDVNKLLA